MDKPISLAPLPELVGAAVLLPSFISNLFDAKHSMPVQRIASNMNVTIFIFNSLLSTVQKCVPFPATHQPRIRLKVLWNFLPHHWYFKVVGLR
jgi:hypothetical protein